MDKQYKNQVELRKKLEVIIKICDLNKMYGSETDYLSNYLDSLKKMKEIELNKVKEIKENVKEKIDAGKSAIRELRSRKKELKTMKQSRILPYTNLVSDDTNKFANDLDFKEIEA